MLVRLAGKKKKKDVFVRDPQKDIKKGELWES